MGMGGLGMLLMSKRQANGQAVGTGLLNNDGAAVAETADVLEGMGVGNPEDDEDGRLAGTADDDERME